MNKMLIGRAYVAVALALSLTLGIFALFAGPSVWLLGIAHLFVAGALAWAYLRPMDREALDEVQRRQKQAGKFVR